MTRKVSPALFFKMATPDTALEEALPAQRISLLLIGFVIDESPRTATRRCRRQPRQVLAQSPAQVAAGGGVASLRPKVVGVALTVSTAVAARRSSPCIFAARKNHRKASRAGFCPCVGKAARYCFANSTDAGLCHCLHRRKKCDDLS